MPERAIQCPQCGAPAPFRGTSLSLVCEYCGSTVVRTGADVELVGKISALVDNGSPILLGGKGRLDDAPFEIIGRLQIRYARGTWNEWYVEFGRGGNGWLSDAQGSFAITQRQAKFTIGRNNKQSTPTFSGLKVGQRLQVSRSPMVITDKRAAQYVGSEGCLPFDTRGGETYYSVDLRDAWGAFMTLDYGTSGQHHEPALFSGRAVTLTELGLRPLRKYEGWRD
ncbi:MAG: DUF4178 domain-containing protein [Myxococcales bacterium]|nr:DUF4178 domain-containing protein [Myxococcales bacterium]MCB9753244.1 DUF4178 domain-containing protein [Myxococcales bacterium]